MSTPYDMPAGFAFGGFKNADGAFVRTGHLQAEGQSRGTIVIATGFRECIEKYYDVIAEKSAEGFDVHIFDWPGQGGSERFIKGSDAAHHRGYGEQIKTLHQFTTEIIPSDSKKPLILMAHSMGAHTGLRFLKEHEGVFDSAILTAPMCDIHTAPLSKNLARQMVKFANASNRLERYVPGGGDWEYCKQDFKGNPLTSDLGRYMEYQDIMRDNPNLRIGDATYGWVFHTFQSIDVLGDENYLRAITTPVLMQVTDKDKVVIRAAQDRAAALMPNCEQFETKGALHEIWRERDELRDAWVDRVSRFLDERTRPPAPPLPKKPDVRTGPRP